MDYGRNVPPLGHIVSERFKGIYLIGIKPAENVLIGQDKQLFVLTDLVIYLFLALAAAEKI